MAGTAVGNLPEGYPSEMKSIGHSPDGHHTISASGGETIELAQWVRGWKNHKDLLPLACCALNT